MNPDELTHAAAWASAQVGRAHHIATVVAAPGACAAQQAAAMVTVHRVALRAIKLLGIHHADPAAALADGRPQRRLGDSGL